jgi:hypothetical protein
MTNQTKVKQKSKYQLFSTRTGEEVTGRIINQYTAKIIFEDNTSEMLYLSYSPDTLKEMQLCGQDHTPEYRFTVLNFIKEGFVPHGHLTIVDHPNPTSTLVDKINEVLKTTNYTWSAKDKVTLSKVPTKVKRIGYWVNCIQLFVRVNGLQFGSTIL